MSMASGWDSSCRRTWSFLQPRRTTHVPRTNVPSHMEGDGHRPLQLGGTSEKLLRVQQDCAPAALLMLRGWRSMPPSPARGQHKASMEPTVRPPSGLWQAPLRDWMTAQLSAVLGKDIEALEMRAPGPSPYKGHFFWAWGGHLCPQGGLRSLPSLLEHLPGGRVEPSL